MPQIETRTIGVALDMHGCPNRCRHCYLGGCQNGRMMEDDLRWTVRQFRDYVRPGETEPFIEQLRVSSWWREPDCSHDYRRLYELEAELGDGKPVRYELLSIWRLARDPGYAAWAKEIGPDTCQITFFGMKETQDWFHRRRGAFRDSLLATERLLDAGMKPRWQFFLTRRILPDIDDLMRLVDRMRIRERVRELGGEFVMFIHPPALEGEGMNLYQLSATLEEIDGVPSGLVEATKKHLNRDKVWTTEAETCAEVMTGPDGALYSPVPDAPELWFLVTCNWNVFTNLGSTKPWWRLGNLRDDSVGTLFHRFENNVPPGFDARFTLPLRTVAERYGNPESRLVVNGIEAYWLERYCADKCYNVNEPGDEYREPDSELEET